MLALAGYPLGLRFRFFDHAEDAPAGHVAPLAVGEFADEGALRNFARGVDVVTYEFENVPVSAVEFLSQFVPVHPPAAALTASQDRLTEKNFIRELGIPTAPFAPVGSAEELEEALRDVGYPAILKTRRMGYDGKGQHRIARGEDARAAWTALNGAPAILEGVVPFARELSLLTVRSTSGEIAFYPLIENHHREGILRTSIAPAPGVPAALQQLAEEYGRAITAKLDYVGVLAIEFFQVGNELAVNEMAPRVHNSGHWTIEGAETSQFENHLRAVLGLPLGSTAPRGYSAMLNCIGTIPPANTCGAIRGFHYHNYGKEPREGRKVGHFTVCADSETQLRERIQQASGVVPGKE
jgi:5-(carboxyamino)imidazole ribonucleotide synthase